MMFFALAIVLLILEIVTGSFYLLVISAAFASAGLSQWLFETSIGMGFAIAAIISLFGVYLVKKHHKRIATVSSGKAIIANDLDIGNPVTVQEKMSNGYWQVQYRGSTWQAQGDDEHPLQTNDIAIITGKNGNVLLVTKQTKHIAD